MRCRPAKRACPGALLSTGPPGALGFEVYNTWSRGQPSLGSKGSMLNRLIQACRSVL